MSTRAPRPAVIFDLDGTLVDSEPNYFAATQLLLAEHGVPDFSWEEHTRFIGISTQETVRTLRERHGIEASVEELLARKNSHYLRLARTSSEAFPEMRQLVRRLHAAGLPLAVASGSSPEAIDAALTGTSLDTLLPLRISAEEVPRGKPEPDVLWAAARRLGVEATDCVVLEDAPPGVEAARRAGMRCVAVPYVAAWAADPAVVSAGLVFAGGQREFDVERTYDWIRQAGSVR